MLARYWQNLVDNPVVVQFAHRTLAYAVALAALATAWIAARRGAGRNAAELAGMTLLQFALGVATIVTGVELWLGVAHQAGAALSSEERRVGEGCVRTGRSWWAPDN